MRTSSPGQFRILHVVGGTHWGGTESWLLNVLRHRAAERFAMDVLVHTDRAGSLQEPMQCQGARILCCKGHRWPWRYARNLRHLLRNQGPFDIVHSHVLYFSGLVLRVAQQQGVPVRIAHSHTVDAAARQRQRLDRRWYAETMKRWIARYATHQLAASRTAAETLRGPSLADTPCQVLHCGIDLNPFRADPPRAVVRRQLQIDDSAFVLGHVGRFVESKNHRHLLATLSILLHEDPSYQLLLVGDGPLRGSIEQEAHERGLLDHVRFLGSRSDVPRLMLAAMDLFLLPSRYEGLGLSLVEAQAAALPCLTADSVPPEATVIGELVHHLSLADGPALWAETIGRLRRERPSVSRQEAGARLWASDFNIVTSVCQLQQLYEDALRMTKEIAAEQFDSAATTLMTHPLLILMLISHVAAAAPAWSALRRGSLPSAPVAAAVSFLLYYDFGLVFELLGYPYDVAFFPSLFEVNLDTQRLVLAILSVSPWVLLVGAWLCDRQLLQVPVEIPQSALRRDRGSAFYLLATLLTMAPAAYGLSRLATGRELWYLRSEVGADLGPFVILLSLPMHLLAFYATLEEAKTPRGRLFALFLALGAICSSLICGQRSLLLFPLILMILSFIRRVRFWQAFALASACVVAAAALLPLFRGAYRDKNLRQDNLVAEIVHNDFSRAGVLATTIDLSSPVGSRVLSYPLSGYVYASLFFVPRQWVPGKGRSTAMQFTGYLLNQRPEWLNWGFGIGMLEELILNVGTRFCLGGVFLYGLALGCLARLQRRQPALAIPLSLGPLFLCGYHLPSLLLNFGLMWFLCGQLAQMFAETRGLEAVSGRLPWSSSTAFPAVSDLPRSSVRSW